MARQPAGSARPRPLRGRVLLRVRVRSHRVLLGAELLVAAAAWYGGLELVADGVRGTGRFGIPAGWLAATPFATWFWPGVLLIGVVALPMSAAAAAEVRHARTAPALSIAAGLALIGWIGVQLLVIGRFHPLQPTMLALGLTVLLLAGRPGRTRPDRC